MEGLTYDISIEEAFEEYLENNEFREIVQSGAFIYIGSRYVINNPENIHIGDNGCFKLTSSAEQNIDKCSLVFEDIEVIEPDDSKRGDSKGSNIKKRKLKYFDYSIQSEPSKETIKLYRASVELYEKQLDHVKVPWERIHEYLMQEGATAETFSTTTHLNSAYFTKAKNHDVDPPSMHTIISIAAGYNWDLARTKELLQLAGRDFSPAYKLHNTYFFIISHMHGCSIEEKNAILVNAEKGFNPLGSGNYSGSKKATQLSRIILFQKLIFRQKNPRKSML